MINCNKWFLEISRNMLKWKKRILMESTFGWERENNLEEVFVKVLGKMEMRELFDVTDRDFYEETVCLPTIILRKKKLKIIQNLNCNKLDLSLSLSYLENNNNELRFE